MLLAAFIALGTFVGMEIVAWGTHRYLMHGPLWFLHASHHDNAPGLELNDLFGVFFSIVAALSIMAGIQGIPHALAVGVGMTGYGAAYFGLHDVVVHRRLGFRSYPKSGYVNRLVRAHMLHHASGGTQGAYGFLWVPEGADRRSHRNG